MPLFILMYIWLLLMFSLHLNCLLFLLRKWKKNKIKRNPDSGIRTHIWLLLTFHLHQAEKTLRGRWRAPHHQTASKNLTKRDKMSSVPSKATQMNLSIYSEGFDVKTFRWRWKLIPKTEQIRSATRTLDVSLMCFCFDIFLGNGQLPLVLPLLHFTYCRGDRYTSAPAVAASTFTAMQSYFIKFPHWLGRSVGENRQFLSIQLAGEFD